MASEDIYFNKNAKLENDVRFAPVATTTTNPYTEKLDSTPQKQPHGDKPFKELKKKKRKKHLAGKIIAAVLVLLVLFTGGVFTAGMVVLSDYEPSSLKTNEYLDGSNLISSGGVYNILLMGIDSKKTESSSRSDSMILMSIDTYHMNIKLTSFMRDSYVSIPGYGWAKLNAACSYGGPQLVVDTIEYNFGVYIDAYAKIGYDMFITLVDGIGGITVDSIDETEAWAMGLEHVNVEPGENVHLTGKEALQYCRIRKGQSDFNRTERQRKAVTLILKKMLVTNPVKLVKLAKEMVGTVQCSISKTQLIKVILKAIPCALGGIESGRVPADGTWYNDTRNSQAVLIVDMAANRDYLDEFIYR